MVAIPDHKLRTESLIENRIVVEKFRTYLGASQLGKPCARELWYQFRHYKTISITPRQKRLFGRGHREEPIVIADLESIDIKIIEVQEGAKFAKGHGGGHHDGRIENVPDAPKTPHLFECKTMNERNFSSLKAAKSVKKSHLTYFVQMQVYMLLFNLTRALFVSVNKNTDERYYERVKLNKDEARFYLSRAEDIIFRPNPPSRIRENTNYYICRWCDYSKICYAGEMPRKGCRSCRNSRPIEKGKWLCTKTNKKLKFKKQLKGCKKWGKIRN